MNDLRAGLERGDRDSRREAQNEFLSGDDGGDRVRSLKGAHNVDPFMVPAAILAKYPHLSFQWANYEVAGRPDHQQRQFEQAQGWRAVPHSMMPGVFAPAGAPGVVIVKDMVLMERPAHLTNEARMEEIARARHNVLVNERQAAATPEGTAPRLRPEFRSTTVSLGEIPD